MIDKPKILIVDDVDFFLDLEKGYLAQTPAKIFTATNGKEALEIAERERPSLIYLDVQMPVMDGLTCLKELKKNPELSSIPVIMVFAPTREIDDNVFYEAGCDNILHKPVEKVTFLDAGRKHLFEIERRNKRISYQALVTLRWLGLEFHCCTEDLSVGGVYLRLRERLEIEDEVDISMVMPIQGSEIFKCSARVAWVNHGFPRPILRLPQGIGVQFLDLSAEQAEFLKKIVESYESPSPGMTVD